MLLWHQLDPRNTCLFYFLPALAAVAIAFLRKKGRKIATLTVLALPVVLAITNLDFQLTLGQKRKGLFLLPIDYGAAHQSVDQGFCPGDGLITRATHAVVLSL